MKTLEQIANLSTKKKLSDSQLTLLPRSGWQDRQAFLKVLIKTKRAIELAEVTTLLTLD